MSTERTVSIIAPANGRKNFVAHDVPVSKLVNYSQYAKNRYFPNSSDNKPSAEEEKRNTTSNEYDLGKHIDEDFARTVAIHIKSSDVANPAPLTLDLFGEDRSLRKLVQIWRVIDYGYKCLEESRDGAIREALRLKIYATAPFSFADFKLLTDRLYFDKGLFNSTMDRVSFLHIKGYLEDSAKEEIEKYCKPRKGWWDTLLNRTGINEDDIEKAAAQKAAREKRKKEQKAKTEANREAREEGRAKGRRQGGRGRNSTKGSGKEEVAEKPVEPFVRKDEDFPTL